MFTHFFSHCRRAAALLTVLAASSWITTGYIAYSNNHMPGADDPLALFDKIYDKPWTRLGPYLVGMCVGWLLFKKDCRIPMSKVSQFILAMVWQKLHDFVVKHDSLHAIKMVHLYY